MKKDYWIHAFKYIEKHLEEKDDVLDRLHIPIRDYFKWRQYLGFE